MVCGATCFDLVVRAAAWVVNLRASFDPSKHAGWSRVVLNEESSVNKCPKNSIFVTGSGYSGSGFVLDFLREQEALSVLPFRPFRYASGKSRTYLGDEILRLFVEKDLAKVHERAADICSKLEKLALVADGALPARFLALARRSKRRLASFNPQGSARWNPEINTGPQPRSELLRDLQTFQEIQRLKKPSNVALVAQALEGMYQRKILAGPEAENSQVIAVSKSVPRDPQLIRTLLAMASPAKILFVIRNPQDQFADFFRCEAVSKKQKLRFVSNLSGFLDVRAEFIRTLAQLSSQHPDQVGIVDFDSLVLRHEESFSAAAEWAGFTPNFFPYSNLDLRRSSSNLGIQYEFEDLRDIVVQHDIMGAYTSARGLALSN